MLSCSSTTTTTDQGRDTAAAIATIHPDIIRAHILTRLDGPTLASTSCASSQLNSLCCEVKLWESICNSSWPSTTDPLVHDTISTFPSGHRSFFSDAFSTVHHPLCQGSQPESYQDRTSTVSRLISAVDIHFEDKLICSRVTVTDTTNSWLSCSPFRVDVLEPKEMLPTMVKLYGDESTCMAHVQKSMRLSWILIDPNTKRALNVSSIRPVMVWRHRMTGEFQARFATVVPESSTGASGGGLVQCAVVLTSRGKEGEELHVREVSMVVEDTEGFILNDKDSLVILQEAMQGERRMRRGNEEEERYDMFLKLKGECNEKLKKREKRSDMVWVASGIMMLFLLGLWASMFFKIKVPRED